SDRFGSQAIVVAIDVRNRATVEPDAICRWEVVVDGGRTPTGGSALEWADQAVELGAGELLVTSMGRDGTKGGFDLELLSILAQRIAVPVVASGGAGSSGDFLRLFQET